MKLFIQVKTGARSEKVMALGEGRYKIEIKERPIEGRANAAVIAVFSKFFKIPQARVNIIRGLKLKNKVLEIN